VFVLNFICYGRKSMLQNRFNSKIETPSTNKNLAASAVLRFLVVALLLTGLFSANTQTARAGGALTVNLVNDGHDAHPGDGFCATASGACTLRAAIEETNALPPVPGGLNILFSLPGGGVHVMSITLGPLPVITNPVFLDGTSQPSCAAPCIVLSGAVLGAAGLNGLTLRTNTSTIKGFIITSWVDYGIAVYGDSNTIQANDIGFWPGNPSLLPNGGGIDIEGSNNLIGGGLASQRNVISGNTFKGIYVSYQPGGVLSSNVIRGNYIGTDPSGSGALGNHSSGIGLYNRANGTTILRNVISGNLQWGILLYGATHTLVRGNKIGTDAAGTGALGNGSGGVLLQSNANNNTIGGSSSGQPNIIAYNLGRGVAVVGNLSVNNPIQQNPMFGNAGLGIDLGPAGVTPNDPQDPDAGPNGLQNFPALISATGATSVITGRLNSTPAQTYTLEFFVSPAGGCDPSGYGEGRSFLGSRSVLTNAFGNVSFSFTSPIAFAAGQVITATATDSSGNTSEFSRCLTAQ